MQSMAHLPLTSTMAIICNGLAFLNFMHGWKKRRRWRLFRWCARRFIPTATCHISGQMSIFTCADMGLVGGGKDYKKKYTLTWKVPMKQVGCLPAAWPSKGWTKSWVSIVTHSHETGDQNACFTCLPKSTCQEIECLLWLGVEPKKVVWF